MAELKGKRVLVTGGAGSIGSHIIDLLCEEGCIEIVALDNMLTGRPANLARALTRGPVRLVHGDICDTALLSALLKSTDIVFHQAGMRQDPCAAEPSLAMAIMANGMFGLLELCVGRGGRRRWHCSPESVPAIPDVAVKSSRRVVQVRSGGSFS